MWREAQCVLVYKIEQECELYTKTVAGEAEEKEEVVTLVRRERFRCLLERIKVLVHRERHSVYEYTNRTGV